MKRPTLAGCGKYSKLTPEELAHWIEQAALTFGVDRSSPLTVLEACADRAGISVRCAGLLGWHGSWITPRYHSTPDYQGDTFVEAWCQAFAAKYCSAESEVSSQVVRDAPVAPRARVSLAPTRRTLFD